MPQHTKEKQMPPKAPAKGLKGPKALTEKQKKNLPIALQKAILSKRNK